MAIPLTVTLESVAQPFQDHRLLRAPHESVTIDLVLVPPIETLVVPNVPVKTIITVTDTNETVDEIREAFESITRTIAMIDLAVIILPTVTEIGTEIAAIPLAMTKARTVDLGKKGLERSADLLRGSVIEKSEEILLPKGIAELKE